ncbi:hypothetical protein AB9M92_06750 [Peribacillus frigoritolerans]|uniref:hypothetical protein n=1 Tax=Peribacillus frigoritolerans TaxID=450367 RepID=UPI0035192BB2
MYLEMDYRNLNLLGSGGMYIGTKNYDAKKQHIGWGAVTAITAKTTSFKKQSGTYTIPANVRYVQIRVTFSNNGETTNKLYVDNLIVRRKSNADLIVDGAITANHLAVNSITAANGALANASITRAKLQNAIIGNAQIEDGTITNAKIGNLAVDNAKVSGISAKAGILEQVLSMRYSINKADSEKDVKKVKEVKPDAIVKDGLNENISITNSQEKLQSIMTEKEGKKLKLSAGNETNDEIRYAIIALKDWEQVPVIENTEVLYTNVPPETRHLFDFNLPDVERENNFQLIAFPFPYEVNADNYESQQTFGSFRVVVIQNKE